MTEKTSHRQILKSTGIVGGSQVINILIGIVRTKVIAVLLGPTGIGILGIFQSTIEIIKNVTGLGLGFSAVRDVAAAAGTNDQDRITRTIKVLRTWVWFTGITGMVLTALFSRALSRYGFGSEEYAGSIAILSIILLTSALSGGQLALLHGLRQVGKMAKATIWGGLSGLIISVPLYFWLGLKGIVPSLIASAFFSLLISWLYSRKIYTAPVKLSLKEIYKEGTGMVKLGFYTVVTGLAATGTMYLIRIFVSKSAGIEAVGQFQAAWTLSAVYLAAVLRSMVTDYYPRLSAVHENNREVNRLVNEQTEIALLIATPLIIGMLSFMDILVSLFYSAKFNEVVPILSWLIAGSFLKVISWPIHFIILAKGRGGYFILSEFTFNIFYFLMVYFGWSLLGIQVTGISYMAGYILLSAILYLIGRKLSDFSWNRKNLELILIFGITCTIAFLSSKLIHNWIKFIPGFLLSSFSVWYSLSELKKVINLKEIIAKISRSF